LRGFCGSDGRFDWKVCGICWKFCADLELYWVSSSGNLGELMNFE
jgi:hypothetical protein